MKSVVDWHRNKEQEFHAEFVSVMDLIDHLALSDGMTVQKVAEALLHFFGQFQPNERPKYGFANEIDCEFVEIDRVLESDHLDDLLGVTASSVKPIFAETSDHFGWMRQELFEFMKTNGVEPPTNLPGWQSHHMSGGREDVVNQPAEYPTPEDFDHEKWPEKLGIAFMAWRYASKADLTETTPKELMKKWLKEHYPSMTDSEVDRLATVANWDNSPGRPRKFNK